MHGVYAVLWLPLFQQSRVSRVDKRRTVTAHR